MHSEMKIGLILGKEIFFQLHQSDISVAATLDCQELQMSSGTVYKELNVL